MPPKVKNPLDVLKRGLFLLKKRYAARKGELQAKWDKLTAEDEHWLDHEANLVDEDCVLKALEATSDYEHGVSQLNDNQKALVKRLREEAGDIPKVVGAKRKLPERVLQELQAKKRKNKPAGSLTPIPKWNTGKKQNADLKVCIRILQWHEEHGQNQSATAKHFTPIYPNIAIKQPLISQWWKDQEKWREEWAKSSSQMDRTAKCMQQTAHREVTEMMDLWVAKAMRHDLILTGKVLQQKWTMFADQVGVVEDQSVFVAQ
ncbi:hypothetical protein EI94DRAFT_1703821 [Lactarius quietus]|nr:hypothetical protein EI94DRAFT_1703821 [Lactarius quietus]